MELTIPCFQINDFPTSAKASSLDDLGDGLILWEVVRKCLTLFVLRFLSSDLSTNFQ